MIGLSLALLAGLTVVAVPFWRANRVTRWLSRRPMLPVTLGVLTLAAAGWAAVQAEPVDALGAETGVTLAVLTALAGGGPAAKLVLQAADPGTQTAPTGPARPGVLTGGDWIGALERIAISATLLARWPDGLLLVFAVKGLGRYPELHAAKQADQPAAAERFIVGSLASALWAAGCAGVGLALLS